MSDYFDLSCPVSYRFRCAYEVDYYSLLVKYTEDVGGPRRRLIGIKNSFGNTIRCTR